MNQIQIELTNRCNFQCEFCGIKHHRTNNDLPIKDVCRLLDRIKDAEFPGGQVHMVSFNGLGEPLLHPNIVEAVAYAKERFPFVGFITNGYCLTKEISDALLSLGIDYVSVSINGVNEDVYSHFQGYGMKHPEATMKRVIDNTIYFLKRRDELGKKTEVRIPFCLTEVSKPHLKEFVTFWRNTGFEILIHVTRLLKFKDSRNVRYTRCEQLTENFLVFANGDIGFCCCNHTRAGIIGNIYKDDVVDVFWSEAFTNIVRANAEGNYAELPPACRICENHRDYGFLKDYSLGYKFIYLNNPLKAVKWSAYSIGRRWLSELKKHDMTWPLFRRIKSFMYHFEYGKSKNEG